MFYAPSLPLKLFIYRSMLIITLSHSIHGYTFFIIMRHCGSRGGFSHWPCSTSIGCLMLSAAWSQWVQYLLGTEKADIQRRDELDPAACRPWIHSLQPVCRNLLGHSGHQSGYLSFFYDEAIILINLSVDQAHALQVQWLPDG